jgi:hypothetical protein
MSLTLGVNSLVKAEAAVFVTAGHVAPAIIYPKCLVSKLLMSIDNNFRYPRKTWPISELCGFVVGNCAQDNTMRNSI